MTLLPSIQSIIIGTWAADPEAVMDWQKINLKPGLIAKAMEGDQFQVNLLKVRPGSERRKDNIAILPLRGIILPRAQLPGATSSEAFRVAFTDLIEDPSVKAILIDIDSPGGQISGMIETSDLIYHSRGKKPVMAIAHFVADAGAYWIGSAADEMIVSPSGETGGIGIMAIHVDDSVKWQKAGIKRTLISAGKYKLEGNPWQPLTEEARGHIQEDVQRVYDQFIEHVARNRGIAISVVRDGFGQGRVVSAEKAMQLHMADHVADFEDVIYRLKVKAILNRTPVIR